MNYSSIERTLLFYFSQIVFPFVDELSIKIVCFIDIISSFVVLRLRKKEKIFHKVIKSMLIITCFIREIPVMNCTLVRHFSVIVLNPLNVDVYFLRDVEVLQHDEILKMWIIDSLIELREIFQQLPSLSATNSWPGRPCSLLVQVKQTKRKHLILTFSFQ